MLISRRAWPLFGLVASSLLSGCIVSKTKTVAMATVPSRIPTPTPTQATTPTMVALSGEYVSKQTPDLVANNVKQEPSRLGSVIVGTVTNRGQREYDVNLTINFLDEKGKIMGTGSDFEQRFGPGNIWNFRTNAIDGFASYKIVELRGW